MEIKKLWSTPKFSQNSLKMRWERQMEDFITQTSIQLVRSNSRKKSCTMQEMYLEITTTQKLLELKLQTSAICFCPQSTAPVDRGLKILLALANAACKSNGMSTLCFPFQMVQQNKTAAPQPIEMAHAERGKNETMYYNLNITLLPCPAIIWLR